MHTPHSEPKQPGGPPASGILLLSPRRPASDARPGAASGQRALGLAAAELAHDARNLISALDLYCDLLASPGVLAPGFHHYADDLRLVAGSGARLIEALAGPAARLASSYADAEMQGTHPARNFLQFQRRPFPGIEDLAVELIALEAPLRALAGPKVCLEVECAPCAGLLALNSEDLLRILFNLVANAVEAMEATAATPHRRAFLRITAQRGGGASFLADRGPDGVDTVVLSVRDNGPGIAAKDLPQVFDPGFSTRHRNCVVDAAYGHKPEEMDGSLEENSGDDCDDSRGLGLSIVRQLAEAAGGAVRAVCPPGLGTRIDIELPILSPRASHSRLEFAAHPRRSRHRGLIDRADCCQPGDDPATKAVDQRK
jgi:signal transduction histidine kinase